jgi:hypothetical protein
MIIKMSDLFLLLRGYNLEEKEVEKYGEALRLRIDEQDKYTEELEKLKKYIKIRGRKLRPAEAEYYDRETEAKDKAVDNAIIDYIAYEGGRLYTEIAKEYKRNKKLSPFLIAGTFYQAKKKVSLPAEGEMVQFPDCYTEEQIFSQVKKAYLKAMDIPVPPEKVSTRLSKEILVNLDKGTRELFKGTTVKTGEIVSIPLERKGRASMVRTFQITPEALSRGIEELNLDSYDLGVLTICNSLLDAGNTIISTETIAQTPRGGKGGDISKLTKEGILSSINKMMVPVVIDFTSENTRYKLGEGSQTIYRGAILPAEIVTVEINGKVIEDGIKLLGKSILFELAERKSQVTILPSSVLSSPGYMTRAKKELTVYLMQRVGAMKPGKNGKGKPLTMRTIRVDTLLNETMKERSRKDRKEKSRQLEKVTEILSQYKREGVISGFCYNYDTEMDEKKQKIIIAMNDKQEREMWKEIKL